MIITIQLLDSTLASHSHASILISSLWIDLILYLSFTETKTTIVINTILHCTLSIIIQVSKRQRPLYIRKTIIIMIWLRSCLIFRQGISNKTNIKSTKNPMLFGPFIAIRKYLLRNSKRLLKIWWKMKRIKDKFYSWPPSSWLLSM